MSHRDRKKTSSSQASGYSWQHWISAAPNPSRRRFLIHTAAAGSSLWLCRLGVGCSGPEGSQEEAVTADLSSFSLEPEQMSTLEALCARLIPTDDDPGAAEAGAAEYIVSELGTDYFRNSQSNIVAAIDGLDQLAYGEHGRAFSELDDEEKDQLILGIQRREHRARGWAGQQSVELFLGLTCEGFLCDPIYGGNRDEVGWRFVGFHRCGPQPRQSTIHRNPARHASVTSVSHRRETYDAIVVGSGAGGGPVAQILSESGMEVLVLEKGPWYTKRDFVHDEIASGRRDFFIPSPEVDPHVVVNGERRPMVTNDGWTSRCVGGGTVHMSGFFLRMHPEDFQLATLMGEGGIPGANIADWPISYEELAPYYSWVERTIGVSGEYGPGQVGAPLPLPPLQAHPFAEAIDEGAEGLGIRTFPTPRAVLSRCYSGRPSCTYCGFCGSYGCENDSKSSSLSTFIPNALATGRCQVRPGAQAREVYTDDRGRARGVRYIDNEGNEHEVRAPIVVLACSAVETARLLLLSDSRRFPRGLANSTGLVGRNLLMSTFAGGEGWFPERAATTERLRQALTSKQPFLQRTSQSFYWIPQAGLSHPKGGSIVFLLPHPNLIHTAEHLSRAGRELAWGSTLKRRLRSYYHRGQILEFEVFAEFLPSDGSHVTLDPEVRDRFDLASARITLNLHPSDREAAGFVARQGLEVLDAAGCTHLRRLSTGRATQILQGGTCRFGTDPDYAVLDRDCQTFDVPNLFVTDGSFMPTSGAVPITLTIMANASRVARRIVEKSQRGELA